MEKFQKLATKHSTSTLVHLVVWH